MSASVILKGVGKRYVKYDDVPLLVTRALKFRAANERTHLWALRNIILEVEPGESFGRQMEGFLDLMFARGLGARLRGAIRSAGALRRKNHL